jgi:uncharacterized protein (TIGR00661 family)
VKVVYGVQSQGQGHANRAAAVIRALRARGHAVDVVTSGQPPPAYAAALLGPTRHVAAPVFDIAGGQLHVRASLAALRRAIPILWRSARELGRELVRARVDLVITDFEPVTAWGAAFARVPVAGLAGQYRMTRTDAPHPGTLADLALAHAFVTTVTPRLTRWLAVSFSALRATRPRTAVVGPLVADDVRGSTPTAGDHVLVYTYGRDVATVVASLPAPHRYRVYGLGGPTRHGHVELCATDRASFVRDLVSCRAVVGNGSFQLASEAAILGKPMLAIPFARQYEERFSAHQVAVAGLGTTADELSPASIGALLACAPPARTTTDGLPAVLAELSL